MKKAFTMAEVLITLVVIGIVAVFILQVSFVNVQDKVRSDQVKTAKIKFAKAMEMMILANEVGPYYGSGSDVTLKFVDNLKKHLKINKICKNDNLSDCFGYEEITLTDGEKFALNDIKTGAELQAEDDEYNDYSSDTVGIETVDGVHMILAFNSKCQAKTLDHTTWAGSKGESNSGTSCVAALIDVDGNKAPNTLGKDVRTIYSARGVGQGCPLELAGSCYYMAQQQKPIVDYATCLAEASTKYHLNAAYCSVIDGETGSDNQINNTNYWYANVMTCGRYNNIAAQNDLSEMLTTMYKEDAGGCQSSVYAQYPFYCSDGGVTYQAGTASRYGLPEPTSSAPIYIPVKSLTYRTDSAYDNKKHYSYSLMALYPDKVFLSGANNEQEKPNTYLFCKKP